MTTAIAPATHSTKKVIQGLGPDLDAFLDWVAATKVSTFDTETPGDWGDYRCVGFSMYGGDETWAIIFGRPEDWTPEWNPHVVFDNPLFRSFFEDEKNWVVIHNAKFDLRVLKLYGIWCNARVWDTLVASFLAKEVGSHTLDFLMEHHFGKGKPYKWSKELYLPENRDKLIEYMLFDADAPWLLMKLYEPKLKEEKLWYAFRVDCAMMRVLMTMEDTGFPIDRNYLAHLNFQLSSKTFALERRVWREVGRRFNLASAADVGKVIYRDMRIKPPAGALTKTGKPSTKEEVLEILAKEVPFLRQVIEWRQYRKLNSTFVEGIISRIKGDGRIHTDFGITTVVTGRLSSFNPNLQNMPRPDWDKFRIRDAFVALPGYKLICCDYSQLELRVLAHQSRDPNMCKAFREGIDIHDNTAKLCGVPRQFAKNINFGIVYGLSAKRLSATLNISKADAQAIITKFFEAYPNISKYIERTKQDAHAFGFVRTLAGRKRRLAEDLESDDWAVRGHAERQGVNTTIQGSASDIVKRAMLNLEPKMVPGECDMLIQVHDELDFMCKDELVNQFIPIIKQEMEHPFEKELLCPLEVDIKVVDKWGRAKD